MSAKSALTLAAIVVIVVLVVVIPKMNKPADQATSSANATSQPAAAKPAEAVITLTYANFPPAPTFPCVQMERWKSEVEKRSNGRVKVNTFAGGTLLDAKDMIDGVIRGQADIGCLCMSYQPGRFIETEVASLPVNIPNSTVGSLAFLDLFKKYKPASFDKVKVLTVFTTAPSNIMSKTAIRKLEDVKSMSLRASGQAADILKAWGANAVGMPMSATPEALEKGVVTGLFSSAEVMKDFKYAESCKFVTMTDTAVYPFAVVMNQKKWDALPKDVQTLLESMMDEQCKWTGEYMDGHVAESLEWSMKENKVEVIALSAEEKAAWNAKLEGLTTAWLTQAKAKGLPAEEMLEDFKAMVVKRAAETTKK